MQTLGGLLQIAPFPLWRLEAAVCPGPHPSPADVHTKAPSPPALDGGDHLQPPVQRPEEIEAAEALLEAAAANVDPGRGHVECPIEEAADADRAQQQAAEPALASSNGPAAHEQSKEETLRGDTEEVPAAVAPSYTAAAPTDPAVPPQGPEATPLDTLMAAANNADGLEDATASPKDTAENLEEASERPHGRPDEEAAAASQSAPADSEAGRSNHEQSTAEQPVQNEAEGAPLPMMVEGAHDPDVSIASHAKASAVHRMQLMTPATP